MLRTLAFIIVTVTGFTASFLSRYYALLFYLWFALFRPQEWVWIDIEQFRFSLLVGMALIVPALLTGLWPNLTHPLCLGMVAFLGTALLGQLHAFNTDVALFHFELLTRIVIVSLLIPPLMTSRSRFVTTVAVMAGSMGYHAAKFGVSYIVWGGAAFGSGIGGAFGTNNELALAIARIVFLMIATIQNVRNRGVKMGFMLALPLSLLGIISTYSRGGFLAVAGGFLVYVALQKRRALALSAIAIGAVVIYSFAPIQSNYFNRLETIRTYNDIGERSAMSRVHFWRVALIMAEANPLGIGLRNFEQAYDRYDFTGGLYGYGRSVHNSHLQALTEAGVLGFLVWVALWLSALTICLRVRRLHRRQDIPEDDRRFF